MLRFGFIALAAGAVVLFAGAVPPGSTSESKAAPANTIVNEPLVVFSVSGGTLTGTVHRQLTVYNNGFVTISKLDHQYFPTEQEIVDVKTTSIGTERAYNLVLRLVRSGAGVLPDQPIFVSDVPLNTLTVLDGKEVAVARTFSWWLGIGEYSGVQRVINEFVQANFPGF